MTACKAVKETDFPRLPWFTIEGWEKTPFILPMGEDEWTEIHPLTSDEPFWQELQQEGTIEFRLETVKSFCRALKPIADAIPEKSRSHNTAWHLLRFFREIESIDI